MVPKADQVELLCLFPLCRSLEPVNSCLVPVIGLDEPGPRRICSPRLHQRHVNPQNLRSLCRAPWASRGLKSAVDDVQLLRFALLNVCSIGNKTFILNDTFINERLDFMCLTETWQRELDYTLLNELCPQDCSVFGTARSSGRRGGGLALVHRDCFPCRPTSLVPFSSSELQMTKVGTPHPFFCVLIYRPPGSAHVFLDEFAEFLSTIIKLESVLIVGDFNIHVDNPSCNIASELITDSFNLTQHVSGPTHVKCHTLDLVFSLGLNIDQIHVKNSFMSDHYCILLNVLFPLSPPSCKSVRDLSHH